MDEEGRWQQLRFDSHTGKLYDKDGCEVNPIGIRWFGKGKKKSKRSAYTSKNGSLYHYLIVNRLKDKVTSIDLRFEGAPKETLTVKPLAPTMYYGIFDWKGETYEYPALFSSQDGKLELVASTDVVDVQVPRGERRQTEMRLVKRTSRNLNSAEQDLIAKVSMPDNENREEWGQMVIIEYNKIFYESNYHFIKQQIAQPSLTQF